ncbi:MAG: hypothetical protein A2W23_01835 [Planctomycetes bacterium RBG_16_43_13]|nr:MAG: hypothetical protein A2W23_01835 [Planctomycetes bacterium RBG_16_43_13]
MIRRYIALFILPLFFLSCSRNIEKEKGQHIAEFKGIVRLYLQNLNNEGLERQSSGKRGFNRYNYSENDKNFVLIETKYPREPLRAKVIYQRDMWFYDPHGGHFEAALEKNAELYPNGEGYYRKDQKYLCGQIFEYDGSLHTIGKPIETALFVPWRPLDLNKEMAEMLESERKKLLERLEKEKEGLPEDVKKIVPEPQADHDTGFRR